MNKNKIKITLLCLFLCNSNVNAFQNLQCSLKCAGKNCSKSIKDLEECANTCPPAPYKQCWLSGLEALNKEGLALSTVDKDALVKRLKANIRSKKT